MLEVAGSPVGVAGGEWRAGKEQLAASAATWQSPDALPRLSQEPPPEGAPYTELLHSLQRIGSDLCRMAAAGGLPGDDWGEWLEEWHALLRQALEQLKRLLVDRAAVSNYPAQGEPLRVHGSGTGKANAGDAAHKFGTGKAGPVYSCPGGHRNAPPVQGAAV